MNDEHQLTVLGPDGPRIEPIGIGTWAWGDKLFWGFQKGYDDSDLRAAFNFLMSTNIRFFDTAEVYGLGNSEKFLGEFATTTDQELVIGTKWFPLPWRIFKGSVPRVLRRSLKRLGMDTVDLYQIHWPPRTISIENVCEGLAMAVEEGLVRQVGVSNFDVEQTRRAYDKLASFGIPLASNQVQYSLVQRGPERSGLLDLCHELNITLIAYSPLGQGTLTGKYSADNPPDDFRGREYNTQKLRRMEPLISLLKEIAEREDRTPAQVAINWTICKGTLPIPGVKNLRQARDNAGAVGWRLSDEDVAALDAASASL